MSFRRDPRKTLVGLSAAICIGKLPPRYGAQVDEDGRVFIRFLDEDGEWELCFKRLMSRPGFALTVARFIFVTSIGEGQATRENKRKLAGYYFSYLDKLSSIFGISTDDANEVDQDNIDGYQHWLDGDKRYGSTLKIADLTKKPRYNFIIELMNWARGTDSFQGKIPDLISRTHRWSGAYRSVSGVDALTAVETARTLVACHRDIESILKKLRFGKSVIEIQGDLPNLKGRSTIPFKTLGIKLAAFVRVVETQNPPVEVFRLEYPGLGRILNFEGSYIRDIVPYMFFTWETIVPIIVLNALETGFNPSLQCGMKESDVSDHPIWPNTLRLAPEKRRANGRVQVRTFTKDEKNPFSVPSLLAALAEYSGWYRKLAAPREKRNLFLVWDKLGSPPCSLLDKDGNVSQRFYRELKKFTARHSLGKFTLSVLRQTVADFAQMLGGGDSIDVQTLMGHKTLHTSERYYNSQGQKKRRDARLAKAVRERQRFIDSNGRVTLNQTGNGIPKRAATPGFLCWDLYGSPVLGQKKGKMCSAYGCCPDCPLACVQIDDPTLPETFIRLKEVYERTREATDHIRWAAHWNPRFETFLDVWLPSLDPAAVAEAYNNPRSPLPELE